jgi:hypothetical protein
MAAGHVIENTNLYVLELYLFGFACASYYLLLKSRATLARLDSETTCAQLLATPSRFGRHLQFGRDLELDADGNTLYYIGPVKRSTH